MRRQRSDRDADGGGLSKNGPHSSGIGMLSHQRVAPFEKDEEAWPSNKNWGWDLRFQKPTSGPESLSAYGIKMQNSHLPL